MGNLEVNVIVAFIPESKKIYRFLCDQDTAGDGQAYLLSRWGSFLETYYLFTNWGGGHSLSPLPQVTVQKRLAKIIHLKTPFITETLYKNLRAKNCQV